MKSSTITLTTLTLVFTLFATAVFSQNQVNVTTEKPVIGQIRKLLQFTGEIRPLVESYAAADVAGPIAQIMVEEGQRVTQNQALGKIDDIRFAISLRQMQAALERAKNQLEEDEKDLERNKTLLERKAITQKAYDMANTVYIRAKTAFKQAQADYDKAKLDLERCIIRAPITGYFIDRSIELGQAMARGQNMGKVIDLDHVYVDARIPESEIRNIKTGQNCIIENQFPGTVEHINLYADNSRSFKVRIKVRNPDLYFKGNMFVKGTITLEEFNDVPLFSSSAIRNYRGEQFIYLVRENKAYHQPVKIKAQEGERTFAAEIGPEDEIVIIGQDNLENETEVIRRNGKAEETY